MINTRFKSLNSNKEASIVISISFIIFLALTKKLIEKVRKEWDESIKRREEELENEKK